jgi:mono/diheme cytochrome c family protein
MTAMKRILATIALALFAALALGGAAQGPPPAKQSPPLILKSTYGADLYHFYCSSCHGATARGAPAYGNQRQPAPDLTVLARRNKGVFPREQVRATITFGAGTGDIRAHGTADMPVWGTIFRGLDADDRTTEIRIEQLVQYLASLQEGARGE